jgi:hypothetical protein
MVTEYPAPSMTRLPPALVIAGSGEARVMVPPTLKEIVSAPGEAWASSMA